MENSMTVAQYVVKQMQSWGIDTVFGVPGDTLLPLLDELRVEGAPRFIVCRHGGAAALMASAYAKVTGKPAACIADAGPGTVQMLNGVYDARMDRVPMLVITGELSSDRLSTHWPQDVNADQLYRGATIYNQTLVSASQAPRIVVAALRRATLQFRPVRIGVPADMWTEAVHNPQLSEPPAELSGEVHTNERVVRQAAQRLQAARRPVLFVGIGAAKAVEPLLRLAEKLQAPIVHSMPAIGAIPADNHWNLGVIGKFGTQAAADVFGEADLILAVGTTWWQPQYVADDAKVIQIDIVRDHIGLTFPVDLGVWGDAADVVQNLVQHMKDGGDRSTEWSESVQKKRAELQEELTRIEQTTSAPLEPGAVIAAVGRALVPDAIVAVDVGNNTFWFSRYMQGHELKVLLSGHWRSVGFSLPGAIAAKLAAPERQVVAISGDGGFGMSMSEFATAVQYRLPIVCIVLSDARYGEEETLQKAHGQKPFGTGLHNPDWAAFARACGAVGYKVDTYDQLQYALNEALPALATGQISILDVAVARVGPMHPQPLQTTDRMSLDGTLPEHDPDGRREAGSEQDRQPELIGARH